MYVAHGRQRLVWLCFVCYTRNNRGLIFSKLRHYLTHFMFTAIKGQKHECAAQSAICIGV